MQDGPHRRVIAVAPMPPEKSAYALARYSRSADSIEDSIRWVHSHSSEKFWEQFLRPGLVFKIVQDFPSYRIFGHILEVLNIDKNKN